ncbi:hypothetical protein EI555_020362, partial [Monodon monoceros]
HPSATSCFLAYPRTSATLSQQDGQRVGGPGLWRPRPYHQALFMVLGAGVTELSHQLLYMELPIRREGPVPSNLLRLCQGHCASGWEDRLFRGLSCWLTSTALSTMAPGSMKKIFSPDDIEQVSSKDDTKTSLKTVVKETSYLMMMQGMSHILGHPLRVISIATRSIFAYLVDDSFSQALAIHSELPHRGGSGMPTYPFLLVGDLMAAGWAPHSLPRVQIRIHCWKDLSGQGKPFRGSSLPFHHHVSSCFALEYPEPPQKTLTTFLIRRRQHLLNGTSCDCSERVPLFISFMVSPHVQDLVTRAAVNTQKCCEVIQVSDVQEDISTTTLNTAFKNDVGISNVMKETPSCPGFVKRCDGAKNTDIITQGQGNVIPDHVSVLLPYFKTLSDNLCYLWIHKISRAKDCKYLINVTHNIHLSWLFIIHLEWQIQSDEAWVEFFPEVNETSVPVFRETRLPLDALGLVAKTGPVSPEYGNPESGLWGDMHTEKLQDRMVQGTENTAKVVPKLVSEAFRERIYNLKSQRYKMLPSTGMKKLESEQDDSKYTLIFIQANSISKSK